MDYVKKYWEREYGQKLFDNIGVWSCIAIYFKPGYCAVNSPYPPFGLATVSFVGLSSYLILVGIYYSAISVSLDISLRKSIRQSIEEHSKFLHGIGSAQMDKGIQEAVLNIRKNISHKLFEDTGVESSITDDDVKKYVSEVLQEIKAGKDKT